MKFLLTALVLGACAADVDASFRDRVRQRRDARTHAAPCAAPVVTVVRPVNSTVGVTVAPATTVGAGSSCPGGVCPAPSVSRFPFFRR